MATLAIHRLRQTFVLLLKPQGKVNYVPYFIRFSRRFFPSCYLFRKIKLNNLNSSNHCNMFTMLTDLTELTAQHDVSLYKITKWKANHSKVFRVHAAFDFSFCIKMLLRSSGGFNIKYAGNAIITDSNDDERTSEEKNKSSRDNIRIKIENYKRRQ
ncbi:CLUMA_CG002811, isoform A [Clunio marinus]|uniref:CLUMA_CG002811, isoform A n=1 Tax=Clunio marinus TaxID=568069 RepID=A0A1J1HLF5_9DIPT|nr:CLUMA_CG002811, isoform A [Clunio marinus]